MAIGLFSFLGAVSQRRAPREEGEGLLTLPPCICRSASPLSLQERIGPICVGSGGAAQEPDFDKSPDRERKTGRSQDVMEHRVCCSGKPCGFRKLAEHRRQPIK